MYGRVLPLALSSALERIDASRYLQSVASLSLATRPRNPSLILSLSGNLFASSYAEANNLSASRT